jgi:hypothetical protein
VDHDAAAKAKAKAKYTDAFNDALNSYPGDLRADYPTIADFAADFDALYFAHNDRF